VLDVPASSVVVVRAVEEPEPDVDDSVSGSAVVAVVVLRGTVLLDPGGRLVVELGVAVASTGTPVDV
jgi:hypothetical protein